MSLANIDVAILCGGRGTRLAPIIGDLPKVLAPIKGRPFIEHLLASLWGSGFQKAKLITGHRHDQVADWWGRYRERHMVTILRDTQCAGFGSALNVLKRSHEKTHPVMILNGDTLLKGDLSKFAHIDKPLAFNVRGVHSGIISCWNSWLWSDPFVATPMEVFTGLDFLDIGTPEGYARAESWLSENIDDHHKDALQG